MSNQKDNQFNPKLDWLYSILIGIAAFVVLLVCYYIYNKVYISKP